MVKLKSLVPAGARKLVKQLLHRSSPAANSQQQQQPDQGPALTSDEAPEHDQQSPNHSSNSIASAASKHEAHKQLHNASSAEAPANAPSHNPASSTSNGALAITSPQSPAPNSAPQSASEPSIPQDSADIDKATMAVGIASPLGPGLAALAGDRNKENQQSPPKTDVDRLTASLGRVQLGNAEPVVTVTTARSEAVEAAKIPDLLDPAVQAERAQHLHFTQEALDMARLALRTNETPVGCVLVHNGKVIARGMNATNVTRNGTRHAEFMALSALLSHPPKKGPRTTCLSQNGVQKTPTSDGDSEVEQAPPPPPDAGNEDGSKGHLFPYGQKCHPDACVDRSIIRESILYVTVEPCVMCASLLRQLGVKKVYFGAVNDKFGGTGGVFSIHANSLPIRADGQTAEAHPTPKPSQLPDGSGALGVSFPPGGGDGGNVEHGYEIEGGWGRDEAVGLLRRFYVQENGRAPVPRKKEGRAARLAALIDDEKDSKSVSEVTLNDTASAMTTEVGATEPSKQSLASDADQTAISESDNVLGVRDENLPRTSHEA